MKFKLYQVDAFTDKLFGGNPASVCPLDDWLDDEILQKIALENNLSETAFFVPTENGYHIRWMTPTIEVPLCGHATLAASYVIFNELRKGMEEIIFQSLSGELKVTKQDELIILNFPSNKPEKVDPSVELLDSLKVEPVEVLFNKAFLVVLNKEEDVFAVNPDFRKLRSLKSEVIVTAPGTKSDFISRFFAPSAGIDEDPVTGFAHTVLTPYWAERLKKKDLHAYQVSNRGGELFLKFLGERVEIAGKAVLYLKGEAKI
jgi:PhzF family phenazine biosynthesis protein